MSFDNWGDGEDQQFNTNMSTFDSTDGVFESFTTSFEESWNVGPTASISRYVGAKFAEKNLTGAQANEKYNLTGTEIAYKDDDSVSDFEAKIAADRHYEKKINQNTLENADGFVGSVAGFAGSLAGGIVDPTNLAAGMGIASIVKSTGMAMSVTAAMRTNVLKQPLMESVVRNTIENFVGSAAVDLVAVPLGESVTREKTSGYQRMMNVIGGTIMGTTIGVGLDAPMIRTARSAVRSKSQQHGSKTPEIMQESLEHSIKNVENGKKPNGEFIEKKYDIVHNKERPDQSPYKRQELTAENVVEAEFFVGKTTGAEDLDQVTFGGDSGYVISDNPNLVSNRVTPLDGSSKGEMMRVQMKKDAKIVTDDLITDEFVASLPEQLSQTAKAHGQDIPAAKFKDIAEQSASIDNIIDGLDDVIDNFDGIPNSNDMMNMTLSRMGFDGYASQAISNVGENSNAIVLFKQSDGTIKGLDNLGEAIPTKEFDVNHPQARTLHDELIQHEQEELRRLQDPKSSVDYHADAVEAAEAAPDMDAEIELDKDFEIFTKSNGIDEADLDAYKFTDKEKAEFEASKNPENFRTAGKALMKCIIESLGRK